MFDLLARIGTLNIRKQLTQPAMLPSGADDSTEQALNTPLPQRPVVTGDTAARLPRWALLLMCVVFALPGMWSRDPWKGTEALTFGHMMGWGSDLPDSPFAGFNLAHTLGGLSMALLGGTLGTANASRLPFVLLLLGTFAVIWYACYHLARHEPLQPAALPFGGQPHPVDYARALADGSLLGLIACLGLIDRGHQAIPEVGQMFAVALLLYGLASHAARANANVSAACVVAGLLLVAAFGAPGVAATLGLVLAALVWLQSADAVPSRKMLAGALLAAALACLVTWGLKGRMLGPPSLNPLRFANLLVWYWWPLWLVAGYALYKRRQELLHYTSNWHVSAPLVMALVAALASLFSATADASLLLSLPPLTLLAATGLPHLKRGPLAAIDWFAVALFTVLAVFLWVMWLAAQTGWPAQPAANIEKLYPGYKIAGAWPLQPWAAALAAVATLGWFALVAWRTSRQRKPLWKGMVLTAGGVSLVWVLLQLLGSPMLQYTRSYAPVARSVAASLPAGECIVAAPVLDSQRVLIRHLAGVALAPASKPCNFALVQHAAAESATGMLNASDWQLLWSGRRPSERDETFSLYKRIAPLPRPSQ